MYHRPPKSAILEHSKRTSGFDQCCNLLSCNTLQQPPAGRGRLKCTNRSENAVQVSQRELTIDSRFQATSWRLVPTGICNTPVAHRRATRSAQRGP